MTGEPTDAEVSTRRRVVRNQRWATVLRGVLAGDHPPGSTPDDFDWGDEAAEL